MPTYRITDPDTGRTFKVDAASGAEAANGVEAHMREEVRLAAHPETATGTTTQGEPIQHYPLGPAGTVAALKEDQGRNWAAMGTALAKPYQFFKQALGGKVDPADISAQRELAQAAPWGAMTGETAALALPLGKLESGAQVAIAASQLPKALKTIGSLATTPAAGAITGGLAPTLPTESKAKQMLESAGVASGARAVLSPLARTVTGLVKPSPTGQAMLDKDITPTVSQGGGGLMGKIVGGAENLAGELPFGLGNFVKSGQQRAKDEIMAAAGARASPSGVPEVPTRKGFFEDMTDEFKQDYNSILGNSKITTGPLMKSAAATAGRAELEKVPQSYRSQFERDLATFMPTSRSTPGLEYLETQDAIRQRVRDYTKRADASGKPEDAAMARAYQGVDRVLTASRNKKLTPEDVQRITNLDDKYEHFLILKKAEDKPGGNQLKNFVSTVEQETPTAEKLTSTGRYQDLTEPARDLLKHESGTASDVLSRKIGFGVSNAILSGGAAVAPGVGGPIAAGAYGLGNLAASRGGSRFLMGQQGWQDQARAIANLLRGRVGTAAGATETAKE